MNIHYTIDWLKQYIEKQEKIEFLFFWGHTPKEIESIDKSCFSQWFSANFCVNNIKYLSTEHWMMAQKALLFEDKESFEHIINAATPAEAKKLGRTIQKFDDIIWNEHKFRIVREGNIHKFAQNKLLLDFLIATKNKVLVEASPVDTIWGIGLTQDAKNIEDVFTWRGENLLGFALMEARDYLNNNVYTEIIN